MNKTIYKTDSKGKVRFLTVRTEGADLIQESGLLDSTSPVEHRSTCTGKNIDKSNETTPEQQAELEAQAKIDAKITEGYFETIESAKNTEVILPMLAKNYKDVCGKIDWSKPVFVQPKLDGMRALAKPGEMISRKGNAIETMSHVMDEVDPLSLDGLLDGELYAHGLNFQENMRLIKKIRPGETEKVMYHVYDMVYRYLPFAKRYAILKDLVADCKMIELVPTHQINSEEELKQWHAKFLSEGYEGTIIRHSDAGYAINHRDDQLLKYKDFLDMACEVIDVIPSEKNPTQGVVRCKIAAGTFGCGMKFSHAEREEILRNKDQYIGKMAEVRFFEYSEEGIPRFPVCCGFREDL